MTSFQDAFHKGIEASESAERARREIFQVLDDCARQVSDASQGHIVVSRELRRRNREEKRTWVDVASGVLPSRESYDALVARAAGQSSSNGEELCEYQIAHQGYPVSLVYAGSDEYCHDKEALEQALIRLLEHPMTGRKFGRLMNPRAPQQGAAAAPGEANDMKKNMEEKKVQE